MDARLKGVTMQLHHLSRPRALVALVAIMLGAACASGGYRTGQASGDLGAVVYFKNESFDEVAVYAITGGVQRSRIGTVMAGRVDTLFVPPGMVNAVGGVHIVARPFGRDLLLESGPITFSPGDAIAISLPPSQRLLVVLPP